MGHNLLLRSPEGCLKHWTLLIISIVPGGFSLQDRKSQPILKISNKKEETSQETSVGWKEALPIALFHTHIVPKKQVVLSPYETLRPFAYVSYLFLHP